MGPQSNAHLAESWLLEGHFDLSPGETQDLSPSAVAHILSKFDVVRTRLRGIVSSGLESV